VRVGLKEKCLLGEGESTWVSVQHLRVRGTDQDIGRLLAQYAQARYGVNKLARYETAEYAWKRQAYFEQNWPQMADRMRGARQAFDGHFPAEDRDCYDFSALVYDLPPDAGIPRPDCSAVFIPKECSKSGHPIVARNFDAWRIPPGMAFPGAAGERSLYSRPFVLELQPRGHNSVIALGGHDLLCPFQDALNDKGLYVTSLADDGRPVRPGMQMAGGRNTGLSSRQLLLLLASACDTVANAKATAPKLRITMDFGLHWLIADASGDATVLAVDQNRRKFFTDAPPGRPLLITNHPLYEAGEERARQSSEKARRSHCNHVRNAKDCTFPACASDVGSSCAGPGRDLDFAYDTFVRMKTLEDAVAAHSGPYTTVDAMELMDSVVCAFKSNDVAGVRRDRRTKTAWSVVTELTPAVPERTPAGADQELTVRFFVDDGSPVRRGSNRLKIKSAGYRIRFNFRSKKLWKHKPRQVARTPVDRTQAASQAVPELPLPD
jgi:hypothetical protein